MPRYLVNATVSFPACVEVTADNADHAEAKASALDADEFEYDARNGEVEFNVTPTVEDA